MHRRTLALPAVGMLVVLLAILLLGTSQAAAWTPVGRIVYEKSGDLWVCRADGTGRHQITSGAERDSSPRWSAGHRWVFFVRDSTICVVSGKGGEVTRLAYSDPDAGSDRYIDSLAVSHDGTKLAFADADPESAVAELMNRVMILDLATMNTRTLYSSSGGNGGFYLGNFSPGDGRLLYGYQAGMWASVGTLDVSTGVVRRPFGWLKVGSARYSPSGKRIAYGTYGASPEYVGIASSSGKNRTRLLTWKRWSDGYSRPVGFSPTGKTLLVVRPKGLYRMTPAGANKRLIVKGAKDADWY